MVTPLAHALFGRLFDNAAMYPPAQAPMEAAIALHDAAERAPWGFARGRLLCPGARLGDLAHELRILGRDNKALRVAAVVGSPADTNAASPLEEVMASIAALTTSTPAVHVDLLEVRPRDQEPDALAEAVRHAGRLADKAGVDNVFVEVAVAGQDASLIRERIMAVAEAGVSARARIGAKVRCGGLEPGMVPTGTELATFLHATRDAHLPFKATAGLHHALAASDESHHGFVGLLLASVIGATADLDEPAMARVLRVQANAIDFEPDGLAVRIDGIAPLTASVEDITAARYAGFVAFGTCSFTEPAHEAAELLGDAA